LAGIINCKKDEMYEVQKHDTMTKEKEHYLHGHVAAQGMFADAQTGASANIQREGLGTALGEATCSVGL
jgi:hypothetical protein